MTKISEKSYAVAVCLSAIFGVIGVQHFYLGRWLEGISDVLLTFGWIYYFAVGRPMLGLFFLGLDVAHTLITTILLLTGNFKDGKDRYVCYPGQKIK